MYMSSIETDRRPAPGREYLDKLAVELKLDKEDAVRLLDLAARSQRQCVKAFIAKRGEILFFRVGN